jgi:ABC-type transport system involved in multi-copper enzyme maturation permease subunit
MSEQTGVETPHGPASQQLRHRVKYRVDRWRSEPNPLWMREMRQSARLTRTPVVLMVFTFLMTMLMAALGGAMIGQMSPADAGTALYHVFFSLAFFVVTLIGPALAANSIASEREGHTWEAVLLTGMRPGEIARGKFWAAYTAIALYIVMLAPVGAVPFLFGGVTPVEVLVAFVFLFLLASLGVAFGLAISSKMTSLRMALLVTLLLAIPVSLMIYLWFGVGLSFAAAAHWPGVSRGAPVWLPTAYARAPFGLEYLVFLVALPVVAITVPAWFLYEVTNANLTSVTDDRSYGLKRWFAVTALVLAVVTAVPMFVASSSGLSVALIAPMGVFALFLMFCAFLFAGEPIGPSRRVNAMLAGAGRLRRALAPGVVKASWLQLALGLATIVALTVAGVVFVVASHAPDAARQTEQIILFSASAAGFFCFVVGLAALLRARAKTPGMARVLLLVFVFVLSTGPWILAAIAGVLSLGSSGEQALTVASPSPFYCFVAISLAGKPDAGYSAAINMFWAAAYALGGFVLVVAAASRCRKIIADHEAVLADADRRLAEEDRLRAQAVARG